MDLVITFKRNVRWEGEEITGVDIFTAAVNFLITPC